MNCLRGPPRTTAPPIPKTTDGRTITDSGSEGELEEEKRKRVEAKLGK